MMSMSPSSSSSSRPWWLLPPGRIHPFWWLGVAVVMIGLDYETGLWSEVPLLCIIPVTLAAWYSGRWTALGLAILLPISRFMVAGIGTQGISVPDTLVRIAV